MHLLQARTTEAAEAVTKKKRKRIKIQLTGFQRMGFPATSLSRERGVNKTASQQLPPHSPR